MTTDPMEDPLVEMTVFLKSGDAITLVNYGSEVRAAAELLMPSDSEYDGGDLAVEMTGIRLFPDPAPLTMMVQPWNVSAVTLVEVTGATIKTLASRLNGGDQKGMP